VKPAANEISLGRSSLMRINQEIAGSAVRLPIAERALGFEDFPAIRGRSLPNSLRLIARQFPRRQSS